MTRSNSPLTPLQKPVRRAAAHPWMETLARLGFAAKGIVYFVIGLLAAQAAFTSSYGKTTDSNGALVTIVNQPFGKFLLALIMMGLLGYALWRIVQTIFDPEHVGEKPRVKHVVQRIGYAMSAIAYLGLVLTAGKLLLGTESQNGHSMQDWTAQFMVQPFGRWLVGLAGLIVVGVGFAYFYEAYKAKFQNHFKQQHMSEAERHWAKWMGQFGIAARGTVFSIIGLFLVLAALDNNASEARGLSGALATLSEQPLGPWLLGTVALGFIAYSLYSLIEARYRQIAQPHQ